MNISQYHVLPILSFFFSASGTNRYFRQVATEFGLKISFVDCSKTKLLEAAITPETKVTQFSVLCVLGFFCCCCCCLFFVVVVVF